MSLQVRLTDLAQAVGTDVKELRERTARFVEPIVITTDGSGEAVPSASGLSDGHEVVSVLRLQSNANCRVRFYSRVTDRTADLTRPAIDDPAVAAGVLLEVIFTASVRDVILTPPVNLWGSDDPSKPFTLAVDDGPTSSTLTLTLTAIGTS